MGSATAYHLARRGEPVLLVEQFRVGHDRGSSHGAARITRHSYADPHCARLMLDAFQAWKNLEADAGQPLYTRVGGVSFGPPEAGYVARVVANLEAIGIPHRRMTSKEVRHALPAFVLPEGYDAVFEPDAGLLAASRIVALEVALARQLGGGATEIRADCPIHRIEIDGDKPVLIGDGIRITADRLVVTAGAWVRKLLPDLGIPLQPTRQQVLYFRPSDPTLFSIGQFPVFIYKGREPIEDYYGMPQCLGCDVKVARHGGPDIDPDTVDRSVVGDDYREIVRGFLRAHIPGLAEAPISRTEVCLYTVAPDDRFIVSPWPARPDLIVASPCSGHGFKFSNLIGRILADLVVEGRTDIDIEPWRLTG
jgi:sarcosine oxidase